MTTRTRQPSKRLGHDDQSGFEFSKELLGEDYTAAINFDRLQKHPESGYIIFEYLLCEEDQTVTPYTSHPNRYWKKNASKFLALWRTALDFDAVLYLVNYAKKGTHAQNQVLLIEVLDMDENGITRENQKRFTREGFAKWFRKINRECMSEKSELIEELYAHKSLKELGRIKLKSGKYADETIADIYKKNSEYLEWLRRTNYPYAKAADWYLKKNPDEGRYTDDL